MLEKERANLLEQWKAEARAEASHSRREQETNQWSRRIASSFHDELRKFQNLTYRAFTYMEAFIANLPLTIGAIALAIVTLGVVWFKFSEGMYTIRVALDIFIHIFALNCRLDIGQKP